MSKYGVTMGLIPMLVHFQGKKKGHLNPQGYGAGLGCLFKNFILEVLCRDQRLRFL